MTATAVALHRALGLTDDELTAIGERLGRFPNDLELAMFSVMWSEHCSYKSSRPLLRTLPTGGGDVVAGPGENAGVVRIGDGLAVAFKLESHNHPSAVEPYQGAATGVGGILRDIFTMGARPVAVLDALRFGDPSRARTRHLVRGVVRGVGGYGNCVGVPTVGGELSFHPSYDENPLVNVMAVGILHESQLMRARADRPGDLAVLFGSTTGRDGIGGASVLASATFGEGSGAKRPSVQVGDPFAEKLLIEASLELIAGGLVEGLQDLGAAGITCAVSETADRSGTGITVDLDAIPLRESDMEPFEVMISESQERMLAIVRPERLDALLEVCRRWDLPAAVIGRVTADPLIRIVTGGVGEDGQPAAGARELARIPAAALTSDAIVHERVAAAPTRRRQAPAPGEATLSVRLPERGVDPSVVLQALLGHPNLASRAWVTSQYDSTVGASTVEGSAHGAAVLRVPGTRTGLAIATDANERVGLLDPWKGAAFAVAECTLNIAVTGARPLGVTDCLNHADPERGEAFWQLQQSVAGLGDACRALGLPITGGNVSLYNESVANGPIAPTCQVGVVGLLPDLERRVSPPFRGAGDIVGVLGGLQPGLGGSVYAELAGNEPDDRPPAIDLEAHRTLLDLVIDAAAQGLLRSAQDVSGGGLAVALAECCIWGDVGADLRLAWGGPPATALFGEGPSRVVVSATREDWPRLEALAEERDVPVERLGETGGDRLRVQLAGAGAVGLLEERGSAQVDLLDAAVELLREAWHAGLPRALGDDTWQATPGMTGPASTHEHGGGSLMCGVVGVHAPGQEAAALAALGIFALQHRGQESAGVAASDREGVMVYKDLGLVAQVLEERHLTALHGELAIAHCRYSTTGSTLWENSQPTLRMGPRRTVAIGHNGNLVNTRELLDGLQGGRGRLVGTTDTEVLTALLADEPGADLVDALQRVLPRVRGAYSLVVMDEDRVIGVRDPYGFRPLALGRLPQGHVVAERPPTDDEAGSQPLWTEEESRQPVAAARGWVLASETAALDTLGAEFVRDVEPGEMVVLGEPAGPRSIRFAEAHERLCVFELIYFARPDSYLLGRNLYEVRRRMGEVLAREAPADADLVMPVPDTGAPAAAGFAEASGLPYRDGMVKNRYAGRTFIQPSQSMRQRGVNMKLSVLREQVRGRRLVVVDDSIVRGTTTRQIVQLLRRAGAAEVHLRISAPPIFHPCFYGIDTSIETELIASRLDIEGIRAFVGADSLSYLSIGGVLDAIDLPRSRFCFACFDGQYPVPVPYDVASHKFVLEDAILPAGT